MSSKEFDGIFGELIKDLKIRKSLKLEKYMFSLTSVLKAILVFATIFKNHFTQLVIINISICIFFSISLSLRPYGLSRKDRYFRNSVIYFESLFFMMLSIFIGRFIDNDEGQLVYEGFLSDEFFHYKMGLILIWFLIVISSLLIGIIVKELVKNLTLRRMKFMKNYWLAK